MYTLIFVYTFLNQGSRHKYFLRFFAKKSNLTQQLPGGKQ